MLVLVVGPSGAGKDTLLDAARTELAEDPRFRFVARVVTRSSTPTESIDPVSPAEFEARREAGDFALWWRAHGLLYGVPADIALDLARARVVVVNVSRAVVAEAASRFPTLVVEVTAPAELLAARLAERGREDQPDIARRLARAIELPLPVEREVIVNDGTVQRGAARLLDVLRQAAGMSRPGREAPPVPRA